jgi:hypothetical protein
MVAVSISMESKMHSAVAELWKGTDIDSPKNHMHHRSKLRYCSELLEYCRYRKCLANDMRRSLSRRHRYSDQDLTGVALIKYALTYSTSWKTREVLCDADFHKLQQRQNYRKVSRLHSNILWLIYTLTSDSWLQVTEIGQQDRLTQ